MTYNFDEVIDRTGSDSIKWLAYGADVVPLWVADMDFRSPEPVIRALRERVEHGIYGYPCELPALRQAVVDRMQERYGWSIQPADILFLSGVIVGFNLACQTVGHPGEGLLFQPPAYMPFFKVAHNAGMIQQTAPLSQQADGRYTIDMDGFERSFTRETRMFLLCNPQNPTGRVFRKEELEQMAEICLRYQTFICSDEIHSDLVFSESQHIPIGSLSPEIAARTITLLAPSKTFNIAGLECSFAIIQNPELRAQFEEATRGVVSWTNLFGLTAGLAAYQEGAGWLSELMVYLQENRDALQAFVSERLPGIQMYKPEGTYLAWLDCRKAEIKENPFGFFLREAKVALNNGKAFGPEGDGFVRLNFGCPRSTLMNALERMERALKRNLA